MPFFLIGEEMISRHNVDSMEDLATYLQEGISNRRRTLLRDHPDFHKGCRLQGEITAFAKVLQILEDQFNVSTDHI